MQGGHLANGKVPGRAGMAVVPPRRRVAGDGPTRLVERAKLRLNRGGDEGPGSRSDELGRGVHPVAHVRPPRGEHVLHRRDRGRIHGHPSRHSAHKILRPRDQTSPLLAHPEPTRVHDAMRDPLLCQHVHDLAPDHLLEAPRVSRGGGVFDRPFHEVERARFRILRLSRLGKVHVVGAGKGLTRRGDVNVEVSSFWAGQGPRHVRCASASVFAAEVVQRMTCESLFPRVDRMDNLEPCHISSAARAPASTEHVREQQPVAFSPGHCTHTHTRVCVLNAIDFLLENVCRPPLPSTHLSKASKYRSRVSRFIFDDVSVCHGIVARDDDGVRKKNGLPTDAKKKSWVVSCTHTAITPHTLDRQ